MKHTILFLFVLLSPGLPGCGYGADAKVDGNTSLKVLQAEAEKGNPDAQCWLALAYGYGLQGCVIDKVKSQELYLNTAKHKDKDLASVQFCRGWCYNVGNGVDKDFKKAVEWYRKSVGQGFAPAQYNLGVCYENGYGVDKDLKEAEKWFRKAAEQGLAVAQENLDKLAAEKPGSKMMAVIRTFPDPDGILKAVLDGDIKKVKELVQKDVKLLKKGFGKQELTLLHIAAIEQNDVLKFLIEQGADVRAKDKDNWTPVYYACLARNHEAILYLLANGSLEPHYDCQDLPKDIQMNLNILAAAAPGWTESEKRIEGDYEVEYITTYSDLSRVRSVSNTLAGKRNSELEMTMFVIAEAKSGALNGGRYGVTTKAGERMVLKIDGVEYPFRWCPAGTFVMGSMMNEPGREVHDSPGNRSMGINVEMLHPVTLKTGFWMLETPVTQEMWETRTGKNPSHFTGNKKRPVESVSHYNCGEFISNLNELGVAPSGYKFSLPTEAQWEYACRAGSITAYSFGEYSQRELEQYAWYSGYKNYEEQKIHEDELSKNGTTHPVGEKKPNAWGLYDMHGNVWEWCLDVYNHYQNFVSTVGFQQDTCYEPMMHNLSDHRHVIRGGAWLESAVWLRSANRSSSEQPGSEKEQKHSGSRNIGFRLALVNANGFEKFFEKFGTDVHGKDDNLGETLLHHALKGEYTRWSDDIAKFLVSEGADVKAENGLGKTPLHFAAEYKNVEILQLLVSKGADVNAKTHKDHRAKDHLGETPLFYAARNKNVEVSQFLVSKGANVNEKDEYGTTPLFGAVRNGNVEVVKFLVSKGADVNAKTGGGSVPLHKAGPDMSKAEREIVEFLLSKGADINAQDKYGTTLLHEAASFQPDADSLKFLVSKGADINVKNKDGETPLDVARKARSNNEKAVEYLISIGAKSGKR